jgi:DNA-binding response OmpR family regulator
MKNKMIVVVEEDEHIRCVLQMILEDHGYSVISSHEIPPDLQDSGTPDLFVLDISLSNPLNTEFYRSIKGNSDTANTPVLLTSTAIDLEEKAAVWKAQAYVSKPFDIAHFVETVDEIFA